MAYYVGLTDDPNRRKIEHNTPPDWQQIELTSEAEARAWENNWVNRPDCQGGTGGTGWHYGYWYTITPHTKQ